ncbi:hypothetical protein BJ742DRAFT_778006 [Cladochytrium replicatum]|nr:hypothetical protein BJ742DRAFT_778006 [Cladochytrium replicatum]
MASKTFGEVVGGRRSTHAIGKDINISDDKIILGARLVVLSNASPVLTLKNGTVSLFFADSAVIKGLQEKLPTFADKFPPHVGRHEGEPGHYEAGVRHVAPTIGTKIRFVLCPILESYSDAVRKEVGFLKRSLFKSIWEPPRAPPLVLMPPAICPGLENPRSLPLAFTSWVLSCSPLKRCPRSSATGSTGTKLARRVTTSRTNDPIVLVSMGTVVVLEEAEIKKNAQEFPRVLESALSGPRCAKG